ncbi:hypothetical protein [Actinoplanes xinjiangensis]|uniref:Uncharacterized protein n=1 Tax=Actinoplanes xinjiangensis TaxID=512350 RepID=A0A316EC02_9ACTN|nr:hypothetical protein [Actinoplanes xinjiangensis]PWK27224.1 hypothetical protein BC793_1566 [Actinoplanes xinjiangensis]GIF45256.1 hypothetical protein Axi01nite_95670 [Actinoplanes xinjiangensis]
MEPTSISAIASSVSATIGMASAVIAAISARNSWRSAQASRDALQDTRVQRTIDNARTELRLLVDVTDAVDELTAALGHAQRDPARVTAARSRLRRTLIVAGYQSELMRVLLSAQLPPTAVDITTLSEELVHNSAKWHDVLRRAGEAEGGISAG